MPPSTGGERCGGTPSCVWGQLIAAPALVDRTSDLANRDLLLPSLAALPPRQRAVLVRRYWDDMSEAEIAAMLGCGVGTVNSQAPRGLKRLRKVAGVCPSGHRGSPRRCRSRHA
jgi:DNA-directed RNA polymerase specialized sigma24 family protein